MTFARILALVWALACLVLALAEWSSLAMVGFPDGHLTVWEQETVGLRRWLLALCVGQALVIGGLALLRPRTRRTGLVGAMVAAGLLVVMPMIVVATCPDSATCRAAYESVTGKMLDHGVGG
jgi:uncharacterized membrane protein